MVGEGKVYLDAKQMCKLGSTKEVDRRKIAKASQDQRIIQISKVIIEIDCFGWGFDQITY